VCAADSLAHHQFFEALPLRRKVDATDLNQSPRGRDEACIREFHRQITAPGISDPTVVTVKLGIDGGATDMETCSALRDSTSRPR